MNDEPLISHVTEGSIIDEMRRFDLLEDELRKAIEASPSLKQAVTTIETVQGKNAIASDGLDIIIRLDKGLISMEQALWEAELLFCK